MYYDYSMRIFFTWDPCISAVALFVNDGQPRNVYKVDGDGEEVSKTIRW